jgi:hypothetical protein
MIEAQLSYETSVLTRPQGATFKKTAFFMVTAVKIQILLNIEIGRAHV